MFKKLLVAMLILGFASAVPVMAQAKHPTIKRADQSSKRAVVRSFALGLLNNKPDVVFSCLTPDLNAEIEQVAKQQNRSVAEIKKMLCDETAKKLKQEIEKPGMTLDKVIDEVMKDAPLKQIGGKWYIDIK